MPIVPGKVFAFYPGIAAVPAALTQSRRTPALSGEPLLVALPNEQPMNPSEQYSQRGTRHGWRSRGYLPHFDGRNGLPQSITFRLADSVPAIVIDQWLDEIQGRPPAQREVELRKQIEKYLDSGYGSCHLQSVPIGALVENALFHFDTLRYTLHAWVVMPNYAHVLVTPINDWGLSDIIGSWKSFTAKEANRMLGRTGHFWQHEYFDRFIRNVEHFDRVVEYIENNPVKAGLCGASSDWMFGSARLNDATEAAGTAAVPGK